MWRQPTSAVPARQRRIGPEGLEADKTQGWKGTPLSLSIDKPVAENLLYCSPQLTVASSGLDFRKGLPDLPCSRN